MAFNVTATRSPFGLIAGRRDLSPPCVRHASFKSSPRSWCVRTDRREKGKTEERSVASTGAGQPVVICRAFSVLFPIFTEPKITIYPHKTNHHGQISIRDQNGKILNLFLSQIIGFQIKAKILNIQTNIKLSSGNSLGCHYLNLSRILSFKTI